MNSLRTGITGIALVFTLLLNTSCITLTNFLDNRRLDVKNHIYSSIFLRPENSKNKNIYVALRNSTDFSSGIDEDFIKDKLINKGYSVVQDIDKADFILQINLRYFDKVEAKVRRSIINTWDESNISYKLQTNDYNQEVRLIEEDIEKFLKLSQDKIEIKGVRVSNDIVNKRESSYFESMRDSDFDISSLIIGGAVGFASSDDIDSAAAGLVTAGFLSFVINKLYKSNNYIAVYDIEISQKAKGVIEEKDKRMYKQDDFSHRTIYFSNKTNYHSYRTRMVSFASKARLSREKAMESISKRANIAITGLLY